MELGSLAVLQQKYIPNWVKLDFGNNSNLKTDIQNRISNTIETDFIRSLNSIRGDKGTGEPLSTVTLLALAYFFSEIFKDKAKDSYYTLEMVKGFLDANNHATYTAIHEIDVKYYELNNAPLFNHCWLIIQSAWFFNSEHFGKHQHIDYVNHYIATGDKLPMEQYNFDSIYLEKKYGIIDTAKIKKLPINGFTLVSQWYFGILFLVCNELGLSTADFFISVKDYREFNPLTKTSRQLRSLAPFKIIECDIKSAFPTFLDVETGATLKDHVYSNLMLSKGITRGEAKTLFNSVCNSGKYKSKAETVAFFLDCGYNQKQSDLLLQLTHHPTRKFYSSMTEYESFAIDTFKILNDLKNVTRLHDAVLFIDSKIKPQVLKVEPNCDFGYKELNHPIYKETFSLSDKRLPYAYIGSMPQGLNLIGSHEAIKPEVKGIANGFIFYVGKYKYYSAGFNLNNYQIDNKMFLIRLETMFSTLFHLNGQATKPEYIYLILQHIRKQSQYVFNVNALYLRFINFDCFTNLAVLKERNYNTLTPMLFKKKIDFILARNEAEKIVNSNNNDYDLFCLLQERITNNDYGYLEEITTRGHKRNNLLVFAIVRTFNLLCTGLERKPRKQVKSEPLYTTIIKRFTLNLFTLDIKIQNAVIQRTIIKYERELKAYNQLINNRPIVQQLFLILCNVAGQNHDLGIDTNIEIQNKLKIKLLAMIEKKNVSHYQEGATEFDSRFITQVKKIELNYLGNTDVLDTDLSNSIFNQISIEDAHNKGEVFFEEYLKFHNSNESKKELIPVKKAKPVFNLPEFDFDV